MTGNKGHRFYRLSHPTFFGETGFWLVACENEADEKQMRQVYPADRIVGLKTEYLGEGVCMACVHKDRDLNG